MSTRSVIAIPEGDSWKGRYHHSDGYPSGVGRELFKLVNERGLKWTRKTLMAHMWSTILSADWSLEPEWPTEDRNFGLVRCHRCHRPRWNGCKCAEPTFPARCYCHGGRQEKPYWIKRDPVCKQGDLDWAYILGAQALVIERPVRRNKNYIITAWETVVSVPWNGPEPEWDQIEKMRKA
jgi:hypothetical protein